MKCKNQQERDQWYDCLNFLIQIVDKIVLDDPLRTASGASYFSSNSDGKDEKKRPGSESHKYKNLDVETSKAVISQEDV